MDESAEAEPADPMHFWRKNNTPFDIAELGTYLKGYRAGYDDAVLESYPELEA